MSERNKTTRFTRREFIKAGTLTAGAAAISPMLPAAARAAESAGQLKPVPRNRTFINMWLGREGRWVDWDLWNPYSIGASHQLGSSLLYEPLAYYSAFADKEYLWLAESYKYSPDFKELTIKTRSGIQVGRDDASIAAARAALGPRLIGASCYDSLERAMQAQRAGADYVAFGSFFPSSVKPQAVRAPIDLLHAARARLDVPIVAIGGITPDTAPALIDAGADAVAVVSALFEAADPSAAALAFTRLFESRHKDMNVL